MVNRPLISAAICVTFCANFVSSATASSLADPFSTSALLWPPQSLILTDDKQFQPCPAPQAASLTLADVTNAALCNNPQTRQVWANARLQAAGVGCAEATYLSPLNGTIAASRSRSSGGNLPASANLNQSDYDLSLSWLIYDFGGREAGIRNARELLEAENATQDAAVQSLFLAAVQAYYQLQASQAARDAALDAEKSARESFNAAEA